MKKNQPFFSKSLLVVVLQILSWTTVLCQEPSDSTILNNKEACINLVICSRGCYQYILQLKDSDTVLFPQELPDNFKSNNLEVFISGIIKFDSVQIYKAGVDDKPIPYLKVPTIRINSVKKIENLL